VSNQQQGLTPKDGAHAAHDNAGRFYGLRFLLLLAVVLTLPLILVALPPRFYPAGFLWDWANALGYFALAACWLLFIYAGRPARFPPFSGRFFANLHRDLGYVCLLLSALHIAVLLVHEPLLIEHMKPTAPFYMLAGLIAAILMLVLVLLSITRLRRAIYQHHYTFRRQHGILSTLLLAMLLIHIIGSGYYLNAVWKTLLITGLCVALVLFYTAHRHSYRGEHLAPRLRNTHRYACFISVALFVVVTALSGIILWWMGVAVTDIEVVTP